MSSRPLSPRWIGVMLVVAALGLSCSGPSSESEPSAVDETLAETLIDPDALPGEEAEARTQDEVQDEPLRTTTVEIYFPSALSDGLVGEYREIFETAQPGDRVKQIIADLISGPTSDDALHAVAPGTRLRQVYVLTDGTAYLDFSSELTEGFGGGSMNEILSVYAIVDSVALGVREVQRVGILVNGRALETLNGHLDLRRPLKPNPRLILGSIIVEAPLPGTPVAQAAAD